MQKHILFLGIDVDDTRFHGTGVPDNTDQEVSFNCRPTIGALAKKLEEFQSRGYELKVCYEATYLGFSLYRDLKDRGYECEVIAPSLVPTLPGKKVKTDRLDSGKLARFYKAGLLTPVHIPSEEQESLKNFIRSRRFTSEQVKATKTHVLFLCKRVRLDYRRSRDNLKASYWTKPHRDWLKEVTKELKDDVLKANLDQLLLQLDYLTDQVRYFDEELEKCAQTEALKPKVQALECFRGISTFTALVLISELGDIKRFSHPKKLTAYAGMDIKEYSSGGKELRFSISKMGNRHIRTAVIEAAQFASAPPRISKDLSKRRTSATRAQIAIADKCMQRLHKKSKALLQRGKGANKVKVACGREMLGFIWEALKTA